MKMILHSRFGMAGTLENHTLVYAAVIAGFLTIVFDPNRPICRLIQPEVNRECFPSLVGTWPVTHSAMRESNERESANAKGTINEKVW